MKMKMLRLLMLFVAMLHSTRSQKIIAARVGHSAIFEIPNWSEYSCFKDEKTNLNGERYFKDPNWFMISPIASSDYGFYTCSGGGNNPPQSFQLAIVENVQLVMTGNKNAEEVLGITCSSTLKVSNELKLNPMFIIRIDTQDINELEMVVNDEVDNAADDTRDYQQQFNMTLKREMDTKNVSCVFKVEEQEFHDNEVINLNTPLSEVNINRTEEFRLGGQLRCSVEGSPPAIVHWRSVRLPEGCRYNNDRFALSEVFLPLECLGEQSWLCMATYDSDGLTVDRYRTNYISYVTPGMTYNNDPYNSNNNNYNNNNNNNNNNMNGNMGSTGTNPGYNSYNNQFKPSNFQPNFYPQSPKYPNRYIPPDKFNNNNNNNNDDDEFEDFNEKNLNTYSDGHNFFHENNLISPYSSLEALNKVQQKATMLNFTVIADDMPEEVLGLSNEQKTILGVVLGLGIPLILIVVILVVCCFCRGNNKGKKTTLSKAMDTKKAPPGPIKTVSGSKAVPNVSVNPTTNPIPAQSPVNVVRGSPGIPDIGARHLGGSGSIPNLNESLQENNIPPQQYTNYSEMKNKKPNPTPFGMADLGGNKAFTNI